ncbi:hypothetical protein Tco_0837384 [Tanacetum coccineum]
MNAITDIRCVLTQKALDAFCDKFHIPEEVHPVLPNQNDTMHERPAGKIGLYTRAANVSHFKIFCRVYGITPTVGLFRCFYVNSKKNGCMSFSKRSDNAPYVTRDPDPVAADFNAQDYATLVAHPSSFRKFPEAFPCLGEQLLLETTIGRTVPLLSVAPDRAESELEASVNRLFDEGGSGNRTEQGDSAGGGGGADIQPVSEPVDTVVEDVAPLQPRRQRKRKTMVVDAGESSHPPKRVAAIPTLPFVTSSVSTTPEHEVGDHIDSVAGPNLRTIVAPQRFVISSDSSHHSGANVAEAEVNSLVRSSTPIMTTVTTVTLMVDPALVAKEKPVKPSLFSADSSSAGGADPNTSVFSDLTGSDFLVGGIRTVINPDTDLQKVYIPQWSVTNGSRLDDGRVCHEMVDEFAPPKFFASVRGMEHDQLFTEFNVGAARQMSLSAEVRMRAEYNVKERRRLKSVVEKQDELLKAMDGEIEDLKAQLLLKETKAVEATRLRARTSNLEAVEKSLRDEVNALKERNTILEKERNALDVKVTDLEASVVGKERDLTDSNAQLTSVKSQNDNLVDRVHELEISSAGLREKVMVWLLTHGMELAIVKCLNSPEYLSALGTAIGKSIEKGMQDGLAAGITHGKEGRVLTDVDAHNPSAEVDYVSALQQLQNVNFPLLTELRSKKDASVETVMDTLRLEGPVAEKLGLNELQPNVDQLMVPIHSSPDQVVIGATALSLALGASSSRVRKIRENIANQRSVLRDVFVPLAEPFSSAVLTGAEGTSDTVPSAVNTTTALSTTFAFASLIAPISVDDYEVVGTDDQAAADGSVASFPNVDDAELHILQ